MAVVVIAINPAEILKRARDTKRINDLSNLHELIQLANSEGLLNSTICNGTNIYISLPSSIDLSNINNLPSGFSWVQVSEADLRKSDSTGWIPINVSDISGFSMPTLPVDPQNTLNDNLYYTFYCNPQQEYILTSYMESKTFGPKGNETSKTNKDGGPDPYLYELGSNLFISPLKPVGSWSFDEGIGTITNDSSGNDNNGTLINGPTWTDGQINKALSFDGVDDYVDYGNDESLHFGTGDISISFWVKVDPSCLRSMIISKGSIGRFWINYSPSIIHINSYFGSGMDYWLYSNKNINDQKWHFITATFDKDGYEKIYIDGVFNVQMDISAAASIPWSSADNLMFSTSYVGNYFKGFVDEVRIYNRLLSAEEIKRHYEMSK